jgi:tetratricopeptide (TPR) repeat protein
MKRSLLNLILLFIPVLFLLACGQQSREKSQEEKIREDTVSSELVMLNNKVTADSMNPDNLYLRAKYFIEQQDVNNALSDIGKAIQLDGKNSSYFVTLSDCYLAMGKIPNCMDALKKAEVLDPKNNDALLKLAEVYLVLRDYQNVYNYTKKAIDFEKNNPLAYFIRGYAALEQGDTSLAIKNFQQTADLDQNYYGAYIELGSLYSAMNNPIAGGYFQTAVRIEPNRPEGYYLLGLYYQNREDFEKAVETYEKLIVISPGFKEAYYNLGYINLVHFNDFQASANYFTKAIAIDPKYTDAYFNRGYSYELMGDVAGARKEYEKALEITPNYENAIIGLNRLD